MTHSRHIAIVKESASKENLYKFVIAFQSPITNHVEHRIIYSPHYGEGIGWLDSTIKFYKERNISFIAYANGEVYDFEGSLMFE